MNRFAREIVFKVSIRTHKKQTINQTDDDFVANNKDIFAYRIRINQQT